MPAEFWAAWENSQLPLLSLCYMYYTMMIGEGVEMRNE